MKFIHLLYRDKRCKEMGVKEGIESHAGPKEGEGWPNTMFMQGLNVLLFLKRKREDGKGEVKKVDYFEKILDNPERCNCQGEEWCYRKTKANKPKDVDSKKGEKAVVVKLSRSIVV